MTEFDYQWKNLPSEDIEYNDLRVKEFLSFTKLKPEKAILGKDVWMRDVVLDDIHMLCKSWEQIR